MEPYMVLADKQVNGHRKGLAFSALPDAPVRASTTPGVLRRQMTRLARWSRVRPEPRAVRLPGAADRRRRHGSSAPARSASAVIPPGC
jgi:hypothetical protein